MKKDKKSKAAGKKGGKKVAGSTGKTFRKLGKGLGGLSTTQLVAGGAALAALGVSYLVARRNRAAAAASGGAADAPDAAGAEQNLATMAGGGI